ncbi:MAG: hypothetical protein RBR86_06940 [Pseudobdellovibrionaceae bacterium]|jgi:hypothetical protein|nr:hypothetical protein [Pseudobdellovibrionaceae bacterium]
MELRKDESEYYEGRKRDGGAQDVRSLEWEDTTIVSTLALANFLSALLGQSIAEHKPFSGKEERGPENNPDTEISSQKLAAVEPAANTYIARATHAYQNTGRAVHDQNVEEPPPVTTTSDGQEAIVSLGADFGEEERDRMRSFIVDLHDLEKRGVREISLLRTLNFLDSIAHGISDAGGNITA